MIGCIPYGNQKNLAKRQTETDNKTDIFAVMTTSHINKEYVETLLEIFEAHTNPEIAQGQRAYMKNNFDFFGIKSPIRRTIQRPFLLAKELPPKHELAEIVKTLWKQPQRELQYFAQELAFKYVRDQARNDIRLYEFMLVNRSWWDTIDFIAPKLVGTYFMNFPEQRNTTIEKWLKSQNIWLQRAEILFQLKYKERMDTNYLTYIIDELADSKEFFINKAIGWILRELSKTDPKWVQTFTETHALTSLSYREATRLLPLHSK